MKQFLYSISFVSVFACMFTVTAFASFSTDFGTTTLKRGSSGQYVTNLQIALNACVANTNLTTDGHFGMGTKRAVMAFQTAKGMKADGSVGAKTRGALGICASDIDPVAVDDGHMPLPVIALGQQMRVEKDRVYTIADSYGATFTLIGFGNGNRCVPSVNSMCTENYIPFAFYIIHLPSVKNGDGSQGQLEKTYAINQVSQNTSMMPFMVKIQGGNYATYADIVLEGQRRIN